MKTKLHKMTEHYLIAALWSSNDESTPAGGEPFDSNYSLQDISEDSLIQADIDCMEFIEKAGSLLDDMDFEQAGHDFWLTRNRHGVGFWDRGLGKTGDELTKIAHAFGELNPYLSDSGEVEIG